MHTQGIVGRLYYRATRLFIRETASRVRLLDTVRQTRRHLHALAMFQKRTNHRGRRALVGFVAACCTHEHVGCCCYWQSKHIFGQALTPPCHTKICCVHTTQTVDFSWNCWEFPRFVTYDHSFKTKFKTKIDYYHAYVIGKIILCTHWTITFC